MLPNVDRLAASSGAGIYAFNVQRVNVDGNTMRTSNVSAAATWAGIVLGNSTSIRCHICNNLTNTMCIANIDRGFVQGSQVTDAADLATFANTSTAVSGSLTDSFLFVVRKGVDWCE